MDPWTIVYGRLRGRAERGPEDCLLRCGLFKQTTESRISHAVFAGFQMAGQTFLKSRIRLGFDGDIVPAIKPLQRQELRKALVRFNGTLSGLLCVEID